MYGESDAATDLGPRPDGLRAPALVCAFKGWNDAGDAASAALQFVGVVARRHALRARRSRGVLRLPGRAPDRSSSTEGGTRAIIWPAVEIFEARVPRAPRDLVLLAGPEPSMRWRAFCAASSSSPRRSGSRWSSRSARCWPTSRTRARCRSPAWPRTRAWSSGSSCARPTTRDRPGSSASCRPPAGGRHPDREPVGERAALRRRGPEPEGGAGARAQARERCSASPSTPRSSRPLRPNTSARSRSPSRATPTSRPSSSGSSRPPRRSRRRGASDPSDLPSGDVLAREFQRFLRQRGPEETS